MSPAAARDALAKMREAVERTKADGFTRNRSQATRHAWVWLLADLERIAGEVHPELMPGAAFPDINRDSTNAHNEAGEGR
jgi:hypothetical protein